MGHSKLYNIAEKIKLDYSMLHPAQRWLTMGKEEISPHILGQKQQTLI
jgi:hypothetical protein